MTNIVCFGEILWDNFASGKKPGGAPMNVALHLHRNNISASIISSIGQDQNGIDLKAYLQSQGVSTEYIQTNTGLSTGIVEVHLDESMQATYEIVAPVAWDEIGFNQELSALVSNCDALIFGSLASRNKTSAETLSALIPQATYRVLDLNLRAPYFEPTTVKRLIDNCNLLKINEHELAYLASLYTISSTSEELILQQLAQKINADTVCVTLGDRGAMAIHQGKLSKHPGFPIEVADTVGAGDAFLATFITGILVKSPIEETLARACAAGALVASKPGANPEYNPEEISGFFK